MSEDNAKQLQSVISIAQTLLMAEKDRGAITPSLIAEKVAVAAGLVLPNGAALAPAATAELIRRFSLWIGQDSTLVDYEGHVPWPIKRSKPPKTYPA